MIVSNGLIAAFRRRIVREPRFNRLLKKDYWQLMIGGLAIFAASKVVEYSLRAIKRVDLENASQSDAPEESNFETSKDSTSTASMHSRKIEKALGLDIGSSFSRISYRNGELVVDVLENREGRRATSTIVYGTDEICVGHIASNNRWLKPFNTVHGTQLLVGLEQTSPLFPEILSSLSFSAKTNPTGEVSLSVGRFELTPSAVCNIIAGELLSTATDRLSSERDPIPAALSVPNFFNAHQSSAALSACRSAGVDCLATVPDAVSAVLAAKTNHAIPLTSGPVLVIDFGGRLVQISAVSCDEDIPNILSFKTLFDLGGEFIDMALVDHLSDGFARANGIDLKTDPMALQRLYQAAEGAKMDLTGSFSTHVHLPFITADQSGPKHLDVKLSRAQFDMIIGPQLARLLGPISAVLKEVSSSNTTATAVVSTSPSTVLLVGGGARMPALKDFITKNFKGVDVLLESAPEDLVCIGAALYTKFL
eukprot:gene6407-12952_t